jgi:ribosomal protein L37E
MERRIRCNTCKFGDWGFRSYKLEKLPCESCIGFHKWQPNHKWQPKNKTEENSNGSKEN